MPRLVADRLRDFRARKKKRGEVRVELYLPRDLLDAIRAAAVREGKQPAEWLTHILKAVLAGG